MYHIYDSHGEKLPYVRIRKMVLDNFKGVEHGEIEFNCSKEEIPYNTKSDILGLYGQNGSGKSSLVEALDLFKGLVSGYNLNPNWAGLVDVSTGVAKIYIELDFQYKDGTTAFVSYETKIETKEKTTKINDESGEREESKLYPYISDEIIKTNLYEDGSIKRLHPIVDTKNNLFCAKELEQYYYDSNDKSEIDELTYIKRKAYDDSQSFVFSNALSEELNKKNSDGQGSKYYEILAEIELFVTHYLFVIRRKYLGLVHLRAGIPIYLPGLDFPVVITDKTVLAQTFSQKVIKVFEKINTVINMIIPNLQLEISSTPTIMKDGEDGVILTVMSVRGERRIPFEFESEGIVKIVSILADYIFAFNAGSATLVVDEFDSGVFEFLLGELLQVFEESGKGQLIFTSHNLRTLEVLDKKFIRFTTTDSKNRYTKLKHIGNTNNLRDCYLKEVQFGSVNEDENVEFYRLTKSFKIAKALKQAGKDIKADAEE